MFGWQGPVNFVSLRSVSPTLMPLAMAMSTVFIHVFGDVPSSPIVGAFQVLPHFIASFFYVYYHVVSQLDTLFKVNMCYSDTFFQCTHFL